VWRLHREIDRSRYAIRRAVIALQRPARREPERSPLRLSLAEWEEISRGLAAGRSLRGIASGLGRAPSTVCREVAANGGAGRYRVCAADRRAWDEGNEMAEHARFSVATGVPVYFCDPRSPWQRGSNENTNGLLRQYFPRSTDFRALTQSDFDNVATELNGRPRQTLGWKSPCQALNEALQ
jgi:IS30 family transposase